MENASSIQTDSSKELYELGRYLSKWGKEHKNYTVYQGLAGSSGVDQNSEELFEIISVVRGRLRKLRVLLDGLPSNEIDIEQRDTIRNAISSFDQLFLPQHLHLSWHEIRSKFLLEAHLVTFQLFSTTARKYASLRATSNEERSAAIAQLESAIEAVDNDDLPEWAKGAIVIGLHRLKLVLTHLQFFGHEEALNQLLTISHRFEATVEIVNKREPGAAGTRVSLFNALNALVFVTNILVVPHQLLEAGARYQSILLPPASQLIENFKKYQRSLPPPDNRAVDSKFAILPSSPVRENDSEKNPPEEK